MPTPAETKPFTAILSLSQIFSNLQLNIPSYQRPYKWIARHVVQLLEDLEQGFMEEKPFRIGTLILHQNGDGHDIVDGQQRLVTLTLLLRQFGVSTGLPLLRHKFRHIDSINNIRFNNTAIADWLKNSCQNGLSFSGYILQNCSFVTITLYHIDEAFQLFDAQNTRGKPLEPYDLLKAFHLRVMSDERDQQLKCVKRWENAVGDKKIDYIGCYLYRARKWIRKENAYSFTKEDIDEFKGITVEEQKPYPYLAVQALQKLGLFQLGQPIINGRLFFAFVDFYIKHIDAVFEEPSETVDFYNEYCYYAGWGRAGDTNVREMYETALLLYADKFGNDRLYDAAVHLYKWAYLLRLNRQRVQYNSVDKYIKENNAFEKIAGAYYPQQVLRMPLGKVIEKYYPIEKVTKIIPIS